MAPVQECAFWVYLRKSRAEEQEEKAEQRDVLSLHRSTLLDIAARDGRSRPPDGLFEEIGSGDAISTRPAFQRLLALWKALPRNHGGVVYCMEISRLSRGLQSQQGTVQDALARAGVLIRTPHRYYDLRRDEDAFLFECEGLIARAELRNTKRRYAAAFDELTRQGRPLTGKAPPGYRWDKNEETFITTDLFPVMQAALRDLFDASVVRVAQRYGLKRDVLLLAARNPVMCGWAPRRHGKHHGEKPWTFPYHKLPRSEWVWPEKAGDWEPAISRADWEALQVVLDRRNCRSEKFDSDEGWCRDVLQFVNNPGPVRLGAYSYPGYHLPTYERATSGPLLYIARSEVHAAAETVIARAFGPGSRIVDEILRGLSVPRPQPEDGGQKLGEVERELARLRTQLDALLLETTDPRTDAERRASLARAEQQVLALIKARSAELKALQASAGRPHLDDLLPALTDLQASFCPAWQAMPVGRKRRFVSLAIERIDVTVEKVPGQRRHRREVTACVPQAWLLERS
jgi:DNA invertase Pin-like site-specific DNA recombinase